MAGISVEIDFGSGRARMMGFCKRKSDIFSVPVAVWLLAVALFFSERGALAATCGDSLRILMHFHGVDSSTGAGVKIGLAGDINHDGYSDVAITQFHSPRGSNIVYGGNPSDSLADQFIGGFFQGIVDLDGDGISDVVTSYVRDQSTTPPGVVYFFKGFADSLATNPYDSLLVPAVVGAGIGVPAAVGYADADSLGDLLVLDENRVGGPALRFYSGCPALDTITDWEYAITNYSHDVRGFGFIDFNGDGHQDIYIGMHADLDTLSYVYVFYGPNFGQSPDLVIPHPTNLTGFNKEEFAQSVSNIGDVNGDGWEDLGVVFDFQSLVYFGGPAPDATYDAYLAGRSHVMNSAGDVNGDGFDDLICGQTRTADGAVDIYLGGSILDASYDCSIYRSDLPPVLLQDIGYNVSSAGDFNGDGIGDFMFSCRNFAGGLPGDVFVIAGSRGIVVGVEERGDTALPSTTAVSQNYPNPFNPSTTIEFDLAKPARTTVRIYNTVGQQVRTLVDRPLGVGVHRIQWDGRDDKGNAMPTGVYVYRLVAGDFTEERKMVLVK
jgi:hypothetical protein